MSDLNVTTPAAAPTVSFADLGLDGALMTALNDANYTTPTPIQAQSIPALLQGRDLLGLAETGTGKTAAFALPILQRLAAHPEKPQPRACRALILAPTRELAIQIADSIATYGRHMNLSHTVIFGGVGARPQMRAMERGVDIVIATPGRLLDLLDTRHIRLDHVTQFVLDEADRMLDMGFIRDVRRIVKLLPKVRQSLLFSATMPNDIAHLAAELLHDPLRVEIARAGKTVDRIDQRVCFLDNGQKRAALAALLQDAALSRVIVFTRTKHGADRVARVLEAISVPAHAIHGNKSQNARQYALEAFRTGAARVLVATDIAARGIDVDDVSHVINYELPNIPESYVHRIGRTARAGNEGIAIALCAPDEKAFLRDIERLTKKPLTVVHKIEGMEAFANLPDGRKRTKDQDGGTPHFKRASAKIEHTRRNNRPYEQRPEPPRRDARPADGADGKRAFGSDRPDARADRGGRPDGRHRDGGRPFGDRKPWQNRDGDRPDTRRGGDRGDARRGGDRADARRGGDDRPARAWTPDGGERRNDDRRGDRPRPDGQRSFGGPRGEGRFERKRPEGRDGERRDRQGDDRGDRRPGGFNKFGGRPDGGRPFRKDGDGPRRDGRGDQRHGNADGASRPRGDRPFQDRSGAPRERSSEGRGPDRDRSDRGPRSGNGGERRHSSGGKSWGGNAADRKPWSQKPAGGNRHGGNRRSNDATGDAPRRAPSQPKADPTGTA